MFSFRFLFSLRIYYFMVLCFWGLRPKSILAQSRPINCCSTEPCTTHLVGHECDPNFGAQTAYPGPDPRETQLAPTRLAPGLIPPRLHRPNCRPPNRPTSKHAKAVSRFSLLFRQCSRTPDAPSKQAPHGLFPMPAPTRFQRTHA